MIKQLLNKLESIYYYRYFSKVKGGSENTLLKKIYKSTDIIFIEKVFQLDFFREIIVPLPLDVDFKKKILVIAPHQDDELIGLGGTLLKYRNKGAKITLVFLTDGASIEDPMGSKTIRSIEAKNVAKVLNAEIIEIAIPNNTMEIDEIHFHKLQSIFENSKWDEIFTIWPLDGPPKHRICAYLLFKILQKNNISDILLTLYSVHTELIPNKYVDISNQIKDKGILLNYYKSQLNAQAYDHLSLARDAWSSRFLEVSNEKRYIEVFFKVTFKEYSKLMTIYNNVNSNQLFKGNQSCLTTFSYLKKIKL